jgi:hypothetical protein
MMAYIEDSKKVKCGIDTVLDALSFYKEKTNAYPETMAISNNLRKNIESEMLFTSIDSSKITTILGIKVICKSENPNIYITCKGISQ